jgi:hypothetical protein
MEAHRRSGETPEGTELRQGREAGEVEGRHHSGVHAAGAVDRDDHQRACFDPPSQFLFVPVPAARDFLAFPGR